MQDNIHELWKILIEYWFLPATILTAFLMAVFRTAKANGKVDWLESIMCGLFSYGIYFALTWLNIPAELGVLIGGFLGYSGTHKISNWISKKLGLDD